MNDVDIIQKTPKVQSKFAKRLQKNKRSHTLEEQMAGMLKRFRKERRLRQKEFAERLEISQALVSDIEQAKAVPTLKLLQLIATEFHTHFTIEIRSLKRTALMRKIGR